MYSSTQYSTQYIRTSHVSPIVYIEQALYAEEIEPGNMTLLLVICIVCMGLLLSLVASSCAAVLMQDFYNDYAIDGVHGQMVNR